MPAPLSGPGLGLQIAQNLYPSELTNAPYDYSTNQVALVGGQQIPIPAGDWYISLGEYLMLEYLDPVVGVWLIVASGTNTFGPLFVKSDGFNMRISNRLATPVGGVVLTGGSSYVQATTTVTAASGGSLWIPIVGGALAVSSITGSGGAGFGVPPLVLIPAPPPPPNNVNGVGGRPAVAYAQIASGSVNTVSMVDQGCGYPSQFTVVLLPNPTDPNISVGITTCSVIFSTTFAGSITGIVNTNPGNAIANPSTCSLTVAGAGTNATVTPVMLTTLTAASVSQGGVGLGVSAAVIEMTMAGGGYPQGSVTLSRELKNIFARPRNANVQFTISGGSNGTITAASAGTIIDGGLFFIQGNGTTPNLNPGVIPAASAGTAGSIIMPTFATTLGGSNTFDVAVMQPAP
jgi:hypothetical protein